MIERVGAPRQWKGRGSFQPRNVTFVRRPTGKSAGVAQPFGGVVRWGSASDSVPGSGPHPKGDPSWLRVSSRRWWLPPLSSAPRVRLPTTIQVEPKPLPVWRVSSLQPSRVRSLFPTPKGLTARTQVSSSPMILRPGKPSSIPSSDRRRVQHRLRYHEAAAFSSFWAILPRCQVRAKTSRHGNLSPSRPVEPTHGEAASSRNSWTTRTPCGRSMARAPSSILITSSRPRT